MRMKTLFFLLVNDMNSGLAYVCNVDPDDLMHFNINRSCMFDINSIQLDSLNMGTNENPKYISISHDLTPEERKSFERILTKRKVVFAWSYEDMPGLDKDIVEHHIPIYPEARPIKQKLHRLRPEWTEKIREQIAKQIQANFLEVLDYPQWLANIVPVSKKDEKVRMCVDFRDLNKTCPKDDFSLPHIDVIIDSASSSAMYSFMDEFLGYN